MPFLKQHWRAVAVVGGVLVAFLAGHYIRPRVEIRTEVKTEWKERVVTQIVEKKVEAETRTQTVYVDRIVRKDGTEETKEEIVTGEKEQIVEQTDTHKEEQSEGRQDFTQVTKPVAPRAWNFSASLAVPLRLALPPTGTPFVIVDVSRRLFGPFSVGVWGSLDVSGQNPAAGLSLGVAF